MNTEDLTANVSRFCQQKEQESRILNDTQLLSLDIQACSLEAVAKRSAALTNSSDHKQLL